MGEWGRKTSDESGLPMKAAMFVYIYLYLYMCIYIYILYVCVKEPHIKHAHTNRNDRSESTEPSKTAQSSKKDDDSRVPRQIQAAPGLI